MAADGSLNFNTKIDQSGFEKGTRTISSGISKLKGSLKSLAKTAASAMPFGKVGGVQKNINGLTSSLKGLAGVAAAAFSVKQILDFAKASKEAYNTQIEQETKLTTIMKQRMGATDAQIDSVKQLAAEQQKLGVIGDEVQLAGAQQVATFLKESDSINTLLPAMNDLLAQQNGLNATTSDAVNIGNMMGKVLQGQTSALKRVGISFSDAEEQVLKYGTESERAAMLAQVITNNVGHMNQALAQTDAGKQKQLANTMGDIKEQFGQAVMQIETAFLPLLSRLASGFSTVASAALSFSSAIKSAFGIESETNSAAVATTTANAAASAADSYEDIAESAEETKKAQENTLASFDKVIKIGKQESAGTPSGGSGGTSPSVTTSPTQTIKASSWADELKKSLQQGDWGGLGKMLADKINSVVSKIKWKEVGEKLGQGITNAFTFAYNFLKNTKWTKIGSGFANFLNGLMKKTNFNLIGRTLGAKLNAMIGLAFGFVSTFNFAAAGLGLSDIINGWFDEVNWEQLGDTLGGMIEGVVEFAFNFVDNLDFEEMAENFATAFNRTLYKIDFKKIGQTVSKAFIGVWKFIGTALRKIDWEKVGKSISEFINGINWGEILKSLFGVIGGIIKATPELLKGVINSLDFTNAAGLFATLFAPKMASKLLSFIKTDRDTKKDLTSAGENMGSKIGEGTESQGSGIASGLVGKISKGLKVAGTLAEAFAIGYSLGTTIKAGLDSIGWGQWIDDKINGFMSVVKASENAKATLAGIKADNQQKLAEYKKLGFTYLTEEDVEYGTQAYIKAYNIAGLLKKYPQLAAAGYTAKRIANDVSLYEDLMAGKLPKGISASSSNYVASTSEKLQESKINAEINKLKKQYSNLPSDVLRKMARAALGLPALATGTVVPANFGRFAAILGDNKKEPEVVSPLSTMKQAVLEALAMQNNQKQPVTINISLDTRNGKRLLTKEVIDDINDIIDTTGKVPINI